MRPPEHRPRLAHARGVAVERLFLHLRPAGIFEPQELGDLVVGFADGVVDGGAEPHIIADSEHGDDLGVPAGGEEQAIRKRRAVGEPRGQRMRLEMIDRDQRFLAHQRDRLGGGQPHDHAADQPGPGGGGDAVEAGEAAPGLLHRLADDQVERLDMGARRDLRHHPAIGPMLRHLAEHHIGKDLARPRRNPAHDGGRGLVATRFQAKNNQRLWRHGCDL